ncbi:type IV pilin protein [Xylella fastidiosa]|uniref:Type IV pilin protein n=1 Tax=Xylella fastidiosa subsp. multiplex TaxID=644357 RepID=A0A9Q4QTI7_XYLFS|nr:type IV pilin protein [Xylella fastidiosa]ERI61101.1 type IV pilin [Xylella fastidiosa subsp. multiplex Griffin-1]ACA12658.1 type IV pilin [Xylella fastidiosa M12]KQH74361.1 type IV pilin [Xylella fastidiosa]MBE0268210.1 type IV pilin protein [Xylella fastidiosa subsp. multiplex]MBE0274857.1 type IV pilin protein [Xylella fastidiosa subsp. multiplex]
MMVILKGERVSKRRRIGARQRSYGYHLIELMVVVAVIAILSSIAYPSYQHYILKSHRDQAKADLVEIAQFAERFRTVNNTYAGFPATNPITQSPRQGTASYLLVFVGDATRTAFTVSAVPQGTQQNDKCGTLFINQAGIKTNSQGELSECW